MKRWGVLAVLLVVACQGHTKKPTGFTATATADLAALTKGQCGKVTEHFDPLMTDKLSTAGLCSAYRTYVEQFGELRHQDAGYSVKRGELTVVRIPLAMAHADGEFRETFHPDGTVAGIYLLKPDVPLG